MNNSTHFHNKKKSAYMITHILAKVFFEGPDFHKIVLVVFWMFQPISPPWCYGIFKPSTVLFDFKCISLSIEGGKRETEIFLFVITGFSILTAVLYSMTVWSQSPSLISSLKCISAFFNFIFLCVCDGRLGRRKRLSFFVLMVQKQKRTKEKEVVIQLLASGNCQLSLFFMANIRRQISETFYSQGNFSFCQKSGAFNISKTF